VKRVDPGNLITVLVGLCFVAAGAFAYAYLDRFVESGREASGVVVEVVYEDESRKSRMHPVVRFRTAEGREILGRSWQHHNSEVGQSLSLLYDPKDPEHIEIGTLASLRRFRNIVAAVCIVFGLIVCLIGIGLELGLLNWRRAPSRGSAG
jgi:hypothetical protein